MEKLKGGLLLINSSLILCTAIVYHHPLAFHLACLLALVLAWYLIKTTCLTIIGLAIVLNKMKPWLCDSMSSTAVFISKPLNQASTFLGGGIANAFTLDDLASYTNMDHFDPSTKFKFVSYTLQATASDLQDQNHSLVVCNLPLPDLISRLVISDLKNISKSHNISVHSKMKRQEIQNAIRNHVCSDCEAFV